MTPQEALASLKDLKDGPEKKFKLVKLFGSVMRQDGFNAREASCAKIVEYAEANIHRIR